MNRDRRSERNRVLLFALLFAVSIGAPLGLMANEPTDVAPAPAGEAGVTPASTAADGAPAEPGLGAEASLSPDMPLEPIASAIPAATATPEADDSSPPSLEPAPPEESPSPAPIDLPTPSPAGSPAGESPSPEVSPTPVIVAPPPAAPYVVTFSDHAAFSERGRLLEELGLTETSSVEQLAVAIVDVPIDAADERVAAARANPTIARMEPDRHRSVDAAPDDSLYAEQWALERIGWPQVRHDPPEGSALVAVLDTGVDAAHPELAGALVPGTSFIEGADPGVDAHGHGTWMAGIVAAAAGNGQGIAGMGLGTVRVMPVTVIGADGTGRDSEIISGIVHAVDGGADVVLMAFSSRAYSAALQAAVDYAWRNDVVVVAAAGNDGIDRATYPAGNAGVVGVSATDFADSLWAASNSGPSVFLGAPGADIVTTAPGGEYGTIDGTSAAAAHVAASAALLRAEDPSLSNGVVVGRLARSAAAAGTRAETGNGRLDLARAWIDTSTEAVKPAGARSSDGGPFVGPYEDTYTVATAGFRSAAQNAVGSGVTTLAIAKPSGTTAGDVMVASIAIRPYTATITAPSGWTLIRRTDQTTGTTNSQATYYRIADSSEGSSYTWTLGGSPTGAAGGIASFSNISSCAPVDVHAGAASPGSLTVDAPSVTTTQSNDMLVTGHSFASAATWTPPTGMTEVVDVASVAVPNAGGIAIEINYQLIGTASVTGIRTATASNDSDVGVGQSVAFRSECTKTWDGGAGTSNWGDANNWNPNGVPTSSDDVSLTGASTINVNVAARASDLTLNNSGLTLTILAGQSLAISDDLALTSGTLNTQGSFPSIGDTTSIGAGSTVGYTSTSAGQTVAALNYGNLSLSGATTKTAAGAITVRGALTVGTGATFAAASYSHEVQGSFTNNGTFSASTGTVTFNGTSAQAIGGSSATTFNNVVLSNTAGVSLNSVDMTVGGSLDLGPTVLTTGANKVVKTSTAIPTRTSGYVAGALQRALVDRTTATTFGFYVGNGSNYTEVLVNLDVSTSAVVLVRSTAGEHPSPDSGIYEPQNVNTYWTVTLVGGSVTFSSATGLSFNYPSTNVDSGADPALFQVRRWNGSSWSVVATNGTPTTTQTNVTGITSATLGDFVVGEEPPVATKLVFTTTSPQFATSEASDTITVERQTATNEAVPIGTTTVYLSTTSSGGSFRDVADSTTITSVTIADGSTSASFRYRDTVGGSPTLTAADQTSGADTGLTDATQVATVLDYGIFTDSADIGGPSIAGSGSHSAGTYTVSGSGADIWGTADQFHFMYMAKSGDVRVTARVVSITNTDPWAKAGVMIRDTTAAGSVHAMGVMTPGNGMSFQWRPLADGTSSSSTQSALSVPYWVRVTRTGDSFTAERSSDGVSWTQQGTAQTITMTSTTSVGLAVTSHNNAAVNTATFDNVSVTSAPSAAADSYSAEAGTELSVDAASGVLANDSDPEDDSLTAALVTNVGSGALTLNGNGSFTYTPNAGFVGSDSFTYRASDGVLESVAATVTINVYASVGFQAEDYVSGSATGAGFSTISEGSALGGEAITTKGDNTNASGPPAEMVTYDVLFPDAGATNTYHLYVRYRLLSDVVNDDSGWALLPLDSDAAVGTNWDQINDLSSHGDTTYRWVDLGATAGVNGVGSYTNVASGLHTWWFGGRENGFYADAFVFSTGANLDTTSEGQTVLDSAVNDRPLAVADAYTVNEDGTLNVALGSGVLANDTDPENDALTAALVTNVTNGSLTFNSDGSFTYTPMGDFNGTDSFTYRARDSMAYSAAATVTLTVNAVNDVPSFTKGANQAVDEDAGAQSVTGWATAISPGASNESSQAVDFIVGNDNGGLFSSQPAVDASGTLTYAPALNASGSATVTVQIHDDGGTANGGVDTSPAQTFTITLNAVNDAPVNSVPAAQATGVNREIVFSSAGGNLVSISDADAGSKLVQAQLMATDGTVSLSGTSGLSFSVGDGTGDATMTFSGALSAVNAALDGLSFTPSTQFTGAASLQIVANDLGATGSGGAQTDTDSVSISVTNATPVGSADAYSTTQGNALVVAAPGVLSNDTDPDPQTLTVQAPRPVSGPNNGSLTLNADGSFTYTPSGAFSGTDTFTYTATDGIADSAEVTVTITVNTTAYVSSSAWSTSFDAGRYVDLSFPAYVAPGATVEGGTFRHSYRSLAGGTTCYYVEVWSGGTVIGTHGSAGSPVSCNSGTSYVSDEISLPEVNTVARANSLTIRLFVSNSAAGKSEHSLATLGVDYWLGNP